MKVTAKQIQNRGIVLNTIYTNSPISRIDISNITGITPATVSEITNQLIEDSIIHEIGADTSDKNKSGRKRILLEISPKAVFYIGSELSEKFISFCVCDNLGTIFAEKYINFSNDSFKNIMNESYYLNELNQFLNAQTSLSLSAIGIAIPGHFDPINRRIITNNLFWKSFDLNKISSKIELPIFFENNVNCMALNTKLFLKEFSLKNFLYFHIGRGMFCSYIYQGEIFAKNNFEVGEIGHTVINPEGEKCECGKKGCLQTYSSEAWIINKAKLIYANSDTTYLKQLANDKDSITLDTILQSFHLGDEGILNILNRAIKYLSISIANILMILDAEKLFLHGELFKDETIRNILIDYIENNLTVIPSSQNNKIEFQSYSPMDGAQGACALCVSRNLIKQDSF